jgi:phosphopantothenate---cysteine ligase (ATP)
MLYLVRLKVVRHMITIILLPILDDSRNGSQIFHRLFSFHFVTMDEITLVDPMDDLTAISDPQVLDLKRQLEHFIASQRETCLRPICLVSSGGTAVDLEVNAVRCLDNFSTGLRGAISVEELLKRGYSIIHLQREGSASPFARVLSQLLGLTQSNHGLTTDSLGKLFAVAGEETDDAMVDTVLEQDSDPWMTNGDRRQPCEPSSRSGTADLSLRRNVLNSSALKKALKERLNSQREGRLLIVPFRTVDEYLLKLKVCAETLSMTDCMAMFFLAAAVSDFYIPKADKSVHKIQSESNSNGLTLHLKPVPKVLGLLRQSWAPKAFVVSFKLETDIDLLREKSKRAVEKYGCHVVIGNLLQSRHQKVWVLTPDDFRNKSPTTADDWQLNEIVKDHVSNTDSLESKIIDVVVQSHFEFISWHFDSHSFAIKKMQLVHEKLRDDKQREKNRLFWRNTKGMALELFGAVLTLCISYMINSTFQRRHHNLLSK